MHKVSNYKRKEYFQPKSTSPMLCKDDKGKVLKSSQKSKLGQLL